MLPVHLGYVNFLDNELLAICLSLYQESFPKRTFSYLFYSNVAVHPGDCSSLAPPSRLKMEGGALVRYNSVYAARAPFTSLIS